MTALQFEIRVAGALLRAVLDVLEAHGLSPIDSLISQETAADRPFQ